MKANDTELDRFLSRAERQRTCLSPTDDRMRQILRRRTDRGEIVRPARGMYARASYWRALSKPQQSLHVLRTLQSLHPDWTFCHESAAVAFGLPVSFQDIGTVHVATSPSSRTPSSRSIRWHVVDDAAFVRRQGLRVTPLERTAFDCMRTTRFKQALAVADRAVRISGRRPSHLISCFERIGKGRAGVRHAIRTMYYADPRSESGGESMARATMIEQGFALPRLQVVLPRPLDPNRTFRIDFLWTRMDGSSIIGEFDGMWKYEDESLRNGRSALRVLADEQHRESQLSLYGMPIVRFSYDDVLDPCGFARLLKSYDVPHSPEAARLERRLAHARSASAHLFTIEPLGK